jgi:hypothetical protein
MIIKTAEPGARCMAYEMLDGHFPIPCSEMKPTLNFLQFWLPIFLCVGVAQSVHAAPTVSVNGHHYVGYTQTTSGTTTLGQYGTSIGISLSDFGDFDPATYFPTSVSFAGSANFPGGQLNLDIIYNSPSTASVQGANHYGVAGGGTYGTAPNAGGYMWGSAGVWSPNFSDVQAPLSATLHGGVLDGIMYNSAAFDANLLPTIPLFTLESLDALANITGNQDIALTLVLPFSAGFSTRYGISELVNGASISVLNVDLDPMLNPTGFTIPASILLPGHDYFLFVSQSAPLPAAGGNFDSYQSYNSVAFSVASTSVPDHGATLALFGSSLVCLYLVRRRSSRGGQVGVALI